VARSPLDGSATKENLNTGNLVDTIAVTRRFDLTDAARARLQPLLPKATKSGRPSKWSKRQLIDRLSAGQACIRAALSWALGGAEPEAGRELAARLARWWIATGRYSEAGSS
jgi:hypothetical protein